MNQQIKQSIIYPLVVVLVGALILGSVSMYNDVQANSKFREDSEKRAEKQIELLRITRDMMIELKTEVKGLRGDVDDLKEINKAVVIASKQAQVERSTTE